MKKIKINSPFILSKPIQRKKAANALSKDKDELFLNFNDKASNIDKIKKVLSLEKIENIIKASCSFEHKYNKKLSEILLNVERKSNADYANFLQERIRAQKKLANIFNKKNNFEPKLKLQKTLNLNFDYLSLPNHNQFEKIEVSTNLIKLTDLEWSLSNYVSSSNKKGNSKLFEESKSNKKQS